MASLYHLILIYIKLYNHNNLKVEAFQVYKQFTES